MSGFSTRQDVRCAHPHRALPIIVGLTVLLLVSGCSGPQPETSQPSSASSSGPQSAAPTANAAEWAESVCGAAGGVRSSLDAIGSDVTFNPAADEGAREQVKSTLNAQVAAARTSIAALGTTIQAIPVDADGAEELKETLTSSRQDLDEAIQVVSAGVAATTAATNAKDFVTGGAQTLQAAKTAKASAATFLTTAKAAATEAGGDLAAAFDSAPSCAQPTSSPS